MHMPEVVLDYGVAESPDEGIVLYTDSDWGSGSTTSASRSGTALCVGGRVVAVKTWSATPGRLAPSSTEAERAAIVQAAREGFRSRPLRLRLGAGFGRDPIRCIGGLSRHHPQRALAAV